MFRHRIAVAAPGLAAVTVTPASASPSTAPLGDRSLAEVPAAEENRVDHSGL